MCDNEQCNLMPIHNNMFYSSRFTVRHHNVMVCHLLLGRIDLYIYNSPKFSAGGGRILRLNWTYWQKQRHSGGTFQGSNTFSSIYIYESVRHCLVVEGLGRFRTLLADMCGIR